ncbi:MAG TPA: hypothetical protein VFN18_10905 [Solirubrobacterales bacterium]|nr:hypothetical protein [Solirubrobacterales bacterium]
MGERLSNMALMRGRPALILLVCAATLIPASIAEAGCIKRHDVAVASGASPNGQAWSVKGTIGTNGSCRNWLIGMDFELAGAGSWGWGTGIPAGGHLTRSFTIEAFDELLEDGSYRVVSGNVSGEATKVVFTMSDNSRLTIRPKSAPAALRRKVVWLRNLRYFVEYYPPTAFVTGVATFNRSGVLLYRDKTFEGF